MTTTPPADPSVEGASDRRPAGGSSRRRSSRAPRPSTKPGDGGSAGSGADTAQERDVADQITGTGRRASTSSRRDTSTADQAVADPPVTGAVVADGDPAEVVEPAVVGDAPATPGSSPARRVMGYRRERFEARKVRRLIRHVDPWSMLKLSVLVALCMWLIVMIAALVLWTVARNAGTISNVESFVNSSLSLQDWRLDGEFIFRQFGLITLLLALGFAAATVVASLVFNLISDIIGGVWVSVIEEETARPVTESNRARRVG